MDIGALLIAASLLILTLPYLARPFLASQESSADLPPPPQADQRRGLLLAVRDLDFDYKTGKISAEDYHLLRPQLLAQAAEALPPQPEECLTDDALEAEIAARKKASADLHSCPHCSGKIRPADRYCPGCGESLSRFCHSCGLALLPASKFCSACGASLVEG